MEYRNLGGTGLKVSVIGMGCEGFSEENYAMAAKMFDAAQKLGINYFDLYASDPDLRRAVGKAIKGRRDKFIIQSHICSIWKNGQYLRTRNLDEVKTGFEEMPEAYKKSSGELKSEIQEDVFFLQESFKDSIAKIFSDINNEKFKKTLSLNFNDEEIKKNFHEYKLTVLRFAAGRRGR